MAWTSGRYKCKIQFPAGTVPFQLIWIPNVVTGNWPADKRTWPSVCYNRWYRLADNDKALELSYSHRKREGSYFYVNLLPTRIAARTESPCQPRVRNISHSPGMGLIILNFLFCGAVSINVFISSAKSSWNKGIAIITKDASLWWWFKSTHLHKSQVILKQLTVRVKKQRGLAHYHLELRWKSVQSVLGPWWPEQKCVLLIILENCQNQLLRNDSSTTMASSSSTWSVCPLNTHSS